MCNGKCRTCKHYHPDERYLGVVGRCEKKDKPTSYDKTCVDHEAGKQHWMCGKEVKE